MGSEDRAEASSLSVLDALRASAIEFDFYCAARRIEAAFADHPRLGQSLKISEDPLRFCQVASLRFEPTTVTDFRDGADGRPPRLFLAFPGLLGPHGPMPLHLTEYVRDRERNCADPTLARFLDIFHHRMISLFYRAWAVNQQAVSFDRPDSDRFAAYIASFIGLGMKHLRSRDEIADVAKLHYSGRLASQTKSAEGLGAILEDYFQVPVEIRQFVGHWLSLPEDCRCRLGETPETGTLGRTAIAGSSIWECQQRFRIHMGPMSFRSYQRLLPNGGGLERLVAWVRNYVGDEFDFEVQLSLRASEVPGLMLGQVGQLGWSTWLTSKPLANDTEDLVLRCA
jgi:type VI secretion system protein ImpH